MGSLPIPCDLLGWVKGLEPSTPGTTIRCSNQLSYTHQIDGIQPWKNGTPEGIRTPGLLLRRQLLYPTELLARMMERVTRIELASPAWKAGALAIVLHPHLRRNPCRAAFLHAAACKLSALIGYHTPGCLSISMPKIFPGQGRKRGEKKRPPCGLFPGAAVY